MPHYRVKARNLGTLDDFTRAYLEAAEWCGLYGAEQEEALDLAASPKWDRRSITLAREDCDDFRALVGDLLAGIDEAQAGMDFWLTRNRHGAGFWDRGLGGAGEQLTELAHGYGEAHAWFDADTETLSLE